MSLKPIAAGLFTADTPPRLVGGRDRASGRLVFPCPSGDQFEPVPLGRTGTVWSFTIQRFRPKTPPYAGPKDFTPFAVAYVELPGELLVESRLTNIALDKVQIGLPVELALIPLDPAPGADTVLVHAFQPVERSARLD